VKKVLAFLLALQTSCRFSEIGERAAIAKKSTASQYLRDYAALVEKTDKGWRLNQRGARFLLLMSLQRSAAHAIRSMEQTLQSLRPFLEIGETYVRAERYCATQSDVTESYTRLREIEDPIKRARKIRDILAGEFHAECWSPIIRDKEGRKICPKCGREMPEYGYEF
jgi:hypothetical protein